MALKPRIKNDRQSKYTTIVDQLMTLVQLGFKEDDHNRFSLVICDDPDFRKSIIASGNYLLLEDEEMGNSINTTVLWDKLSSGIIPRNSLTSLINLIEAGNVRDK